MNTESWFSQHQQWKVGGVAALVGVLLAGVSQRGLAQIVPDQTLGSEGSVVKPNIKIKRILSDRIEGGATRGANLFHSFEDFNLGEGRGAYFANPSSIENILTRVTGSNPSNILGRLGVLGEANLFLLNPNGIVFGENASLDLQGSFLATTANAVKLGDAGLFSASQPATSNLLSISPSAFWFNAVATEPIVNRSQAQSLMGQPNSADLSPGLQVQPGRTLALLGGNVVLDGGRLTAAGPIELGSVAGVGQVSLRQTGNRFILGYDSINNFGKISLLDGAFVDASGEGGGGIEIRGTQLELTQGSNIRSNTFGAQNGGEVQIRTTETSLNQDSFLTTEVAPGGTGAGGDITINTDRLLVRDGSQLSTRSSSRGDSGNLRITASESVEIIGEVANFRPTLLSSEGVLIGNAGTLRIDTKRLLIRDGAFLFTNTFGSGGGGRLQINASESVEVAGESTDGFPTVLAAQGWFEDAGDLRIDTDRFLIRDGARVSTSTFYQGNGGNLLINASESVELVGRSASSRVGSILDAQSESSGDAGDLKIDTKRLLVRDGAVISSASFEDGKAGDINITARNVLQANDGTIKTSARRSAGGAITIKAGEIRLFDNSDIRTDVASGADNGGTITLTADSILAFKDSNILSFARDGKGGDITLKTPAFFGEDYRPAPAGTTPRTLDNNNQVDINATGAVSGVITLPDVTFIQNSLTELPENQVNTDALLAKSCIVPGNPAKGSFVITGTGGLPQHPGEAQMSSFPTVDVATLPSDRTPLHTTSHRPSWQKGDPIVEPQGVYRLSNGKLVLSRECS